MARVGPARMTQNTHTTDLILMFEKNVFWYAFFRYKLYENNAYTGIRTRSLPICKVFFENVDFCVVSCIKCKNSIAYTGMRIPDLWLWSTSVLLIGPYKF